MGSFRATKTFTAQDQLWFAGLSGDFNPIHVDALQARRTNAGTLLVHGLHTVFWCLNEAAAANGPFPTIRSFRVRFLKPVYVGELVEAVISRSDDRNCTLEALIEGSAVCRIVIGFGEAASPMAPFLPETATPLHPKLASEPDFREHEGASGRIGFPCLHEQIEEAFPDACRVLSVPRALSLLTTTTLVGMVCPGLHSMFGGLSVTFCSLTNSQTALDYRVELADERFRIVRMEIAGAGLFGTVESFARRPPTRQASIVELAAHVPKTIFAGATTLVLGGSRGLGEVTAKLLAAGGAHVIITYATGLADAEAIIREIREWGGRCDMIPYDIRGESAAQLAALPAQPTHFYHFATPPIFRRKARIFVADRFEQFLLFYVTAFNDIFNVLYAAGGNKLVAFYPSTIFVQERPADMTEYAMAKAAGEVLCADLAEHLANAHVVVNRLPRLATDQTASLIQIDSEDPINILLPLILEVQGLSATNG